MTVLRCERQSLLVLATMAVFGAANLVFLASVLRLVGFVAPVAIWLPVMGLYTLMACRGTLEALSVYRYDEDGIERRHPLARRRMPWSEVRDFRIRRSTGDASFFLKDGSGRSLRVDFQLLGEAGTGLFRLLVRKLQPLIDAKLEAMEREPRLFPRRHLGFIPLPGSVTAGAGLIRSHGAGSVELRLDSVREVAVKEVKKLVATQGYVVAGEGGRVAFLSFVDDSPLLLKYLRAKVPEDRWKIARSGSVFVAKLAALALVPVMAWAAVTLLAQQAPDIAAERALAARSQHAEATVLEAERIDERRFRVAYSFPLKQADEGFGAVVARGTMPVPGQRIRIRYDPERPYYSRPEPGQGIEVPDIWGVLGPAIVMLLLSLPYAAATLAYKVRQDPFEEWISQEPARASPQA